LLRTIAAILRSDLLNCVCPLTRLSNINLYPLINNN
jgi:hypothetical protein